MVADLPVLASIAYGVFVVGYYVLLEGYLGQTIGKMVVGIRVVAEATAAWQPLAAAVARARPVFCVSGHPRAAGPS